MLHKQKIIDICYCSYQNFFYIYFTFSSTYDFASFKKLPTISIITNPIGNAAIMDTDCKLFIELYANNNAIGNKISKIHHIS